MCVIISACFQRRGNDRTVIFSHVLDLENVWEGRFCEATTTTFRVIWPTSAGGRGCHEKRMRYEQDSPSPMSPAESPAKRARTGLSADDRPSIRLMQKIAAHVVFGHLQSISNDLEIPEGAFSQAVCNTAGSKPKSQIYKVQWDIRY